MIVAAGDDMRLHDAASWLDRHTARLAYEPFYDMHFRHHLARARIATRSSALDDAAEHAEAALSWADRDGIAVRQSPRPRIREGVTGTTL